MLVELEAVNAVGVTFERRHLCVSSLPISFEEVPIAKEFRPVEEEGCGGCRAEGRGRDGAEWWERRGRGAPDGSGAGRERRDGRLK